LHVCICEVICNITTILELLFQNFNMEQDMFIFILNVSSLAAYVASITLTSFIAFWARLHQ
jgi:uncharacterized membrane protein (DUF485 family)